MVIKQFVKVLYPKSVTFEYVFEFFPKISKTKIKGRIFIGTQIKKVLESTESPIDSVELEKQHETVSRL